MASFPPVPAAARATGGLVARSLARLPRGGTLEEDVWARRHRGIVLLLWAQWTLTEAGATAGDLLVCLEVTESVVMEQPEASATVLRALKDLGVRVAMDDFGTGYSSLAYLRQFPFDLLKIDRAFVAGVTASDQDRAIVRTIVDLARALGLTVVAEGVETPEQLAVLRELGCEVAQGYLFARPQPAEGVTAILRAGSAAVQTRSSTSA
jgi:EAL domain-containing protein (putative c-di-GMP-specific phosphodiesterase class I)